MRRAEVVVELKVEDRLGQRVSMFRRLKRKETYHGDGQPVE